MCLLVSISFHLTCLAADGACIICDPPLKSLAKQLSENFNKGLMNESEEESEEVTSSNDDNSRDLELSSAEEAEKYYNWRGVWNNAFSDFWCNAKFS